MLTVASPAPPHRTHLPPAQRSNPVQPAARQLHGEDITIALKFSKFTRPNIRKLEPGYKLAEHGITFERLDDGDGRYAVNIMVDGQHIHRVIGKESEGATFSEILVIS